MIKQGDGGFPKKDLEEKLKGKERGSFAATSTKILEESFYAIAWKGKSEKMKGKCRKYNWISTFIATDYTTTIDGLPVKKRYDCF